MDISVVLPTETLTEQPVDVEATGIPFNTEEPVSTLPFEVAPSGDANPTGTPEPLVETPDLEKETLRVAFIKNGNAWLWTEGDEVTPLTRAGGVLDVSLSDDGQVIAFTRQDLSLWMIRSDRSDARPLVTAEEFM